MRIRVSKHDVMRRVAMTTAYLAVKSEEAERLFGTVPVVGADVEMTDELWRQSVTELNVGLRNDMWGGSCRLPTRTGDDYEAEWPVPGNFDKRNREVIHRIVAHFLHLSLTAKWLAMTMPGMEKQYAEAAQRQLEALNAALLTRKRPDRPQTRY